MKLLNLADIRLRKRLALGFGLLMAPVVLVAMVVMSGNASQDRAHQEMVVQYDKALLVRELTSVIDEARLDTWSILGTKDPAAVAALKAKIDGLRESQKGKIETLRAAATTDTGRQLLARMDQALVATRAADDRVLELVAQGKNNEAMVTLMARGTADRLALRQAADELVAWRERRIKDAGAAAEASKAAVRWMVVFGAILVLAATLLVGVAITRSVARPIAASGGLIKAISKGDLTSDVPAVLLSRKDEAGDLAVGTAGLIAALRGSLLGVVNGSGTLQATSEGLTSVSRRLTEGAKVTAERMQTAATAAEESSSNTASVAASMEQASTNLSSVAAAAEQMSATVGEIAASSEKARAISERAVEEVQSMTSIMRQLGQAAQEIGKVTEAITGISAQTNLLALNATIEAARAGAAGKGFAVVANEIKDLAGQTGTATEDIKTKIGSVQDSAKSAIGSIEKIAGVIKDVGAIVSTIAAAIEEQATVTKNVASNVAEASAGIRDANERVAQTASVSRTMAEDITRVSSEGKAMRRESAIVEADVVGLRTVTGRLLANASKFQIGKNLVDFGAIKQGHIQWRGRLLEMFEGRATFVEQDVRNYHVCALGKWYESAQGQRFQGLPSYAKIGAHHQAFHALVGDIVGLWKVGKEDEALGQYEKLLVKTGELFVLLDDLAIEAVKMAA